jgi:hypothetical protein
MALPYSSATQISPDWSPAASSKPISQNASMQVGSGLARKVASTIPVDGVYRRRVGCAVRTVRSRRWRCWPVGEPTGPEKEPVWMLDTRS